MRGLLSLLAAAIPIAGCAATHVPQVQVAPGKGARPIETGSPNIPAATPVEAAEPPPSVDSQNETQDGVMHIVQAGQTLWRIARVYGVPVETIATVNGIDDPSKVIAGTPLFIPGAMMSLDVQPWPAPLPPSGVPRQDVSPLAGDFLWPIDGGALMRPFGEPRKRHKHAGVDIRGIPGQSILAAREGTVAFSGRTQSGYGTMVVLDHGDGVQSLYAHAQRVLVHAGDPVVRGQAIAVVGRTGNASTEHCHFEVRMENRPVNPMPFFSTATTENLR